MKHSLRQVGTRKNENYPSPIPQVEGARGRVKDVFSGENKKIISFCKENNIELLVVFGSQAYGNIHPSSDIDVAVKFRQGKEISKLKLIYKLNDLFSGRNIDLVILRTETDPLLLFEIFFNGKFIYEEYPGLFDKERLRAWKLYIDTEKLRLMQNKYLKEFVRKMRNVA